MTVDGFAPAYAVELLCTQRPFIRKRALLDALRRRCPDVAPIDSDPNSDLLSFVYRDHPLFISDIEVPAQTFIATTDKRVSPREYDAALQQSWKFAEAREAVGRCQTSVLVTDILSSSLPYDERIDLFQRALLGVLEVVPCEAIHWQPSQQIVSPDDFIRAAETSPAAMFFAGPLNVRFFNVSDSPGDMLTDTLGLAAIGLPDLQCHFRDLDPDDVARVLHNTAWYIFQEGDVIGDGHTVAGTTPGSKWHCQHEESLTEPKRVVLDLNPGPPHAAEARRS